MVILNVFYEIKETTTPHAFYKALCAAAIPETCQHEAGNIRYHYYYPADDSHVLMLLEIWQDEASLKAHQQTEHFRQIAPIKEQFVANTSVQRYDTCE
jgi:quinol monooxygenase YgiN